MVKDEQVKAELRDKCRADLDKIIEQSQHLKELLDAPEKDQFVNWEHVGILLKMQQELGALSALLQGVVKPIIN